MRGGPASVHRTQDKPVTVMDTTLPKGLVQPPDMASSRTLVTFSQERKVPPDITQKQPAHQIPRKD